jgi:hypothetical protein
LNPKKENTMRSSLLTATILTMSLVSTHAGEVSGKGPNGGRLADAGSLHVEFVSKGAEVSVFTYDHDNKAVSSSGMAGRITVQESGKTRNAVLSAEAPNRLTGKLDAPLADGAKVIVSITLKGGKPVQARYTAN